MIRKVITLDQVIDFLAISADGVAVMLGAS
jgi:hypothetical protein